MNIEDSKVHKYFNSDLVIFKVDGKKWEMED